MDFLVPRWPNREESDTHEPLNPHSAGLPAGTWQHAASRCCVRGPDRTLQPLPHLSDYQLRRLSARPIAAHDSRPPGWVVISHQHVFGEYEQLWHHLTYFDA